MQPKEATVIVRRGIAADATQLARLAVDFHREDGHPLSEHGVRALQAMLAPEFRDGRVLVLQSGERLCGYGALSLGYGIEHGGPEAFVEDLYVEPEYRARGFGRALYLGLENEARALGLTALHLEVMRGNPAERWYRRMGFDDRNSQLLTKPLTAGG